MVKTASKYASTQLRNQVAVIIREMRKVEAETFSAQEKREAIVKTAKIYAKNFVFFELWGLGND